MQAAFVIVADVVVGAAAIADDVVGAAADGEIDAAGETGGSADDRSGRRHRCCFGVGLRCRHSRQAKMRRKERYQPKTSRDAAVAAVAAAALGSVPVPVTALGPVLGSKG